MLPFLLLCPLLAQQTPPVDILRGDLIKWDPSGWFHVARREGRVEICRFDGDTFITDRVARIEAASVEPGGQVEAVVDRRGESTPCRALTIYVRRAASDGAFEGYRKALARQRHVLDHIFPRGDTTFAGVVLQRDSTRLVVKTRSAGRKVIRLRDDTHFTADGVPADCRHVGAPDEGVRARRQRNWWRARSLPGDLGRHPDATLILLHLYGKPASVLLRHRWLVY